MKVKVTQFLGPAGKTKKDNGSGVRRCLVQYPDQTTGLHLLYHADIAVLAALEPGAVVDIAYQELAFVR